MTAWSAWLDYLAPSLPGCPVSIINQAVLETARDLCMRSRVWRAWLADVDAVAGQAEYALIAPAGAQIVRMESATYGGEPLMVKPVEELDADESKWAAQTGVPHTVTFDAPELAQMVPTPAASVTGAIRFRVSLMPALDATGIADNMAGIVFEAVRLGALARLLMMDRKPWTNVSLGAMREAAYEEQVAAIRMKAARAFSNGRIRSRTSWC